MKHLLVAWSFVSIVLTITEMLMYPAQTLATTALSLIQIIALISLPWFTKYASFLIHI